MASIHLPSVALPLELKPSLQRGHPWIYRDHLTGHLPYAPGSWVEVRCGGFRAIGLFDPDSPIAIRLYAHERVPDNAWIARQVERAWLRREPLRIAGSTNAYRLINGEGDGLPGIVVDLYGPFAALRLDSPVVEGLVPAVVAAVERHAGTKGICRRTEQGLEVLSGRAPGRDLIVEEHGVRFHADLGEGQKTGLFLDHRENRRSLAAWCSDRSVLNLFSYTGGFSLYAARAGAKRVVSVDRAPEAMNRALDNVRLNGLDEAAHELVTADALQYLEQAAQRGLRFDVVISDPPSFARAKNQRHRALRAYERLHTLALGVLSSGGLFAAASCTSQVAPESFRETIAAAAGRVQRRLQIVMDTGHALDHPIMIGHPEGRYLKFVVVRCLDTARTHEHRGARSDATQATDTGSLSEDSRGAHDADDAARRSASIERGRRDIDPG
jgi:23S rRNA (cytosine1962-C5)-methyltransferase